MPEKKDMKKVDSGWRIVEFEAPYGSYAKGDRAEYHESTLRAMDNVKGFSVKVIEKKEKWVPKEAKK